MQSIMWFLPDNSVDCFLLLGVQKKLPSIFSKYLRGAFLPSWTMQYLHVYRCLLDICSSSLFYSYTPCEDDVAAYYSILLQLFHAMFECEFKVFQWLDRMN